MATMRAFSSISTDYQTERAACPALPEWLRVARDSDTADLAPDHDRDRDDDQERAEDRQRTFWARRGSPSRARARPRDSRRRTWSRSRATRSGGSRRRPSRRAPSGPIRNASAVIRRPETSASSGSDASPPAKRATIVRRSAAIIWIVVDTNASSRGRARWRRREPTASQRAAVEDDERLPDRRADGASGQGDDSDAREADEDGEHPSHPRRARGFRAGAAPPERHGGDQEGCEPGRHARLGEEEERERREERQDATPALDAGSTREIRNRAPPRGEGARRRG